MKKIKIISLIPGLLLICSTAGAQFFSNPSFEGNPGLSVAPPTWHGFDAHSTPDTEPLPCDYFTASDGDTYLTLVTRGEQSDFPSTSENVITSLLHAIEAGKYYKITLDLASREDVGIFSWEEGFTAYNAPLHLLVYGSPDGTQKGELLAESEEITQAEWNNHTLIMAPLDYASSLILEAENLPGSDGWGNILLDNLFMEEIEKLPLDYGNLIIPNVFTPNGDGINDELIIKGLKRESTLLIFDRTGREVFGSTDYQQDWDGKDKNGRALPPDTYWYVLLPSHLDEVKKGFIYLKKE